MNKCIFCSDILDNKTKPEHILLNALGGRKKTKKVICSSCNNKLGSGPDSHLANSVAAIRNAANFLSGDGKAPPTIRGIVADGLRYDLLPGSIPIYNPTNPLETRASSDGQRSIQISARDKEHFQRLLEAAIKKEDLPKSIAEKLRQNAHINAKIFSNPRVC